MLCLLFCSAVALTSMVSHGIFAADSLWFEGQSHQIDQAPLEPWLAQHADGREKRKKYGLHFPTSRGMLGYEGEWKVEDGELLLTSISTYGGADLPLLRSSRGQLDSGHDRQFRGESLSTPPSLTPDPVPLVELFDGSETPVKATWYSGAIRIATGRELRRKDLCGNDSVHEQDVYLTVKQGDVVATRIVDNQKAGRFVSVDDRIRVFSSEHPDLSGEGWKDARSIDAKTTKKVRTRGLLSTMSHTIDYENGNGTLKSHLLPRDEITLEVLETLAHPGTSLKLILPDSMQLPNDCAFVEVVLVPDAHSARLRVQHLRLLKQNETIHHPDFGQSK